MNAKTGYRPALRERVGLAARKAAAQLIGAVIDDQRSLEKLTAEETGLAALRILPAHDRALARAIATTALRRRGEIGQALDMMLDRKPPQKARHLLHTLHAAAAQILFMDVPDSAAVDLAVTAVSEDGRTGRFAPMTNAILRHLSREKDTLVLVRSAKGVFPKWLADTLRTDHGKEQADAIAAAILDEPSIDLTLSPAISGEQRSQLVRELEGKVLPTGSLRMTAQTPVRQLPGYSDGVWWVQDAASALPARLLGNVEGLLVADLCAAPGGKTAQLAANGGKVTAVDQSGQRLQRLNENLARLKLEVRTVEADILEWSPPHLFDAILLDAPCSSTGTMRRHPDIIWSKSAQDVLSLASLQEQMIRKAVTMLKPGGTLVYSNCSLLKLEGEAILAKILAAPNGLKLLPVLPDEIAGTDGLINGQGALRTLPSHWPDPDNPRLGGLDGFFACRFTTA